MNKMKKVAAAMLVMGVLGATSSMPVQAAETQGVVSDVGTGLAGVFDKIGEALYNAFD